LTLGEKELVRESRGLLLTCGIGDGSVMMRDVRKHPRIGFHLPVEIPGLWLHMVRDFSLGVK